MALVHTVAEGKIQNTRYTRAHTHDTKISQKVLSLSSIVIIKYCVIIKYYGNNRFKAIP